MIFSNSDYRRFVITSLLSFHRLITELNRGTKLTSRNLNLTSIPFESRLWYLIESLIRNLWTGMVREVLEMSPSVMAKNKKSCLIYNNRFSFIPFGNGRKVNP